MQRAASELSPPMIRPPLLTRTNAVFLDLDGTLAPITDDPEIVALPPESSALLQRLAVFAGGAAAIISGRDLRDLDRRTPRALARLGAHGLECVRADEAPAPMPPPSPPRLLAAMARIAEAHPGAWLEAKGPVIAIHYRKAPHAAAAIYDEVKEAVACATSYAAQLGKMVVEAKPSGANKGQALRAAMAAAPFLGRAPVMVGDDATDEDAFPAAEEFGGYAVKVGAGATRAKFRLQSPEDVIAWLRRSVG